MVGPSQMRAKPPEYEDEGDRPRDLPRPVLLRPREGDRLVLEKFPEPIRESTFDRVLTVAMIVLAVVACLSSSLAYLEIRDFTKTNKPPVLQFYEYPFVEAPTPAAPTFKPMS